MKRRTALAAVSAAAVAGPGMLLAQQPILVKFSHVVTNDTPKGKGALKFQELAQKYTNGKVKIEVYPNSTLYKDKEEMDALASGAVQLLAPSTAKFRPIGVPEFEAMDLPFIFNGEEGYYKTIQGPIGKGLLKRLEAKNITGLAYWDNGFHMVSANKPLLMPADFQGLKVRISGSKIADLYFRKLGARCRRSWPSPRSTRRCRPAWSTAARTRRPTTGRRSSTRCKSTSPSPAMRTCSTR